MRPLNFRPETAVTLREGEEFTNGNDSMNRPQLSKEPGAWRGIGRAPEHSRGTAYTREKLD